MFDIKVGFGKNPPTGSGGWARDWGNSDFEISLGQQGGIPSIVVHYRGIYVVAGGEFNTKYMLLRGKYYTQNPYSWNSRATKMLISLCHEVIAEAVKSCFDDFVDELLRKEYNKGKFDQQQAILTVLGISH